jgi:hypothetical protein
MICTSHLWGSFWKPPRGSNKCQDECQFLETPSNFIKIKLYSNHCFDNLMKPPQALHNYHLFKPALRQFDVLFLNRGIKFYDNQLTIHAPPTNQNMVHRLLRKDPKLSANLLTDQNCVDSPSVLSWSIHDPCIQLKNTLKFKETIIKKNIKPSYLLLGYRSWRNTRWSF